MVEAFPLQCERQLVVEVVVGEVWVVVVEEVVVLAEEKVEAGMWRWEMEEPP